MAGGHRPLRANGVRAGGRLASGIGEKNYPSAGAAEAVADSLNSFDRRRCMCIAYIGGLVRVTYCGTRQRE